jgi:8-oxo-dGTP pyrophosphatase MutT (NUDIX family)
MLTEKSVAVIIFRKEEDFRFLLLYKTNNGVYKEAWEFPKGIVKVGEKEKETGIREVFEETGLSNEQLEFYDFHDKVSFFYRNEHQELVNKEVTFLIARTTRSDIKISSEHSVYRWAPYLEAFDLLTQKNNKEILRKAYEYAKRASVQRKSF